MSIQNIRTSLSKLEKQEKSTNKATNNLLNKELSVNTIVTTIMILRLTRTNTPLTIEQQTTNTRLTTTKEVKKERSKEIKKEDINISSMNNIAFSLNEWAKLFFNEKFIGNNSYDTFDKLTRIDNYKSDEIKEAILWARNDDFWSANFLSPLKLRNKDKNGVKYIDIFLAKILTNGKNRNNNNQGASAEQLAETFIKHFGGQE